jgi:hypothetical protein
MTTLSAVSSVVGGLAMMAQGQQQADMADLQSRQVALQGRLDAIKTNEDLIRTISQNNVAAVYSGLQSSGSVEYAKQQSMANAAEQLNMNRLNVQTKKEQIESAGRAAKTQGLLGAASSGISAGDILFKHLNEKRRTTG